MDLHNDKPNVPHHWQHQSGLAGPSFGGHGHLAKTPLLVAATSSTWVMLGSCIM